MYGLHATLRFAENFEVLLVSWNLSGRSLVFNIFQDSFVCRVFWILLGLWSFIGWSSIFGVPRSTSWFTYFSSLYKVISLQKQINFHIVTFAEPAIRSFIYESVGITSMPSKTVTLGCLCFYVQGCLILRIQNTAMNIGHTVLV